MQDPLHAMYARTCGHLFKALLEAEVVGYVGGQYVVLNQVQHSLVHGVRDVLKDVAALRVEDAHCLGEVMALVREKIQSCPWGGGHFP